MRRRSAWCAWALFPCLSVVTFACGSASEIGTGGVDGGGVDGGGVDATAEASSASDAGIAEAAADATDGAPKPLADAGLAPVGPRLLAVGNLHTCAVRPGGTVKCWGASADKQLGPLGSGAPSMTPLDVGLSNVVEIAAGYAHSCARRGNGEVWCWGEGISGQLGDGLKTNSATPVKVSGLIDAVSIVSNWAHTCALRSNGKIACWGNGGPIGDGTADAMLVPKEPPGLLPVTNVTVGWGHTCVVLQGGTAKCWGTYNAWGQLGDGDTKDRLAPVDVVGLVNAASVESGSYHVCALHAGMTVSCWGNAQGGQIGTGAMGDATHPLAEPVPSLSNVDMLHAKGSNTCARVRAPGAAGGDIYCWGGGPIGDGTTEAKPSPTIIPGLGKNVVELAVGENHHCARLATGEIRCWGNNTRRQLSDGSIVNRDTPVAVQGL